MGQEDGGEASSESRDGGPGESCAVAAGPAAKEAGHALEVVVRSVGVGKKADGEKQKNGQHGFSATGGTPVVLRCEIVNTCATVHVLMRNATPNCPLFEGECATTEVQLALFAGEPSAKTCGDSTAHVFAELVHLDDAG